MQHLCFWLHCQHSGLQINDRFNDGRNDKIDRADSVTRILPMIKIPQQKSRRRNKNHFGYKKGCHPALFINPINKCQKERQPGPSFHRQRTVPTIFLTNSSFHADKDVFLALLHTCRDYTVTAFIKIISPAGSLSRKQIKSRQPKELKLAVPLTAYLLYGHVQSVSEGLSRARAYYRANSPVSTLECFQQAASICI